MTVIGVGLDLVDIDAFAEQLGAPGSRFGVGAFTAGERADLGPFGSGAPDTPTARRLAARFAAKEAFLKAWSGSRFGREPSLPSWSLHEVEVLADVHGRPALRLTGEIAAAVAEQFGDRWRASVSLSHDGGVAGAVVVLEDVSPGVEQ